MIKTWQNTWSAVVGPKRSECMQAEIDALRKANSTLIKELWLCHSRSGYEQDESSIENCIKQNGGNND